MVCFILFATWTTIRALTPSEPLPQGVSLDLSALTPGDPATIVIKDRVILVVKLTESQLEQAIALNTQISRLRDPLARNANLSPDATATLANRTLQADATYVILEVQCDAFETVPAYNAGDFDGWFCTRRAGHFDILGRIRKGAIGANFPIPSYLHTEDNELILFYDEPSMTEEELDRILYGSSPAN